MKLCSLCDYSYLPKFLALHKSLMDTTGGDFTLYFLSIDDRVWGEVEKRNLPNVINFLLPKLEDEFQELVKARENPATTFGTQYSQYCWTLTPFFTNYILNRFVDEDEKLLYVDSDIYFYKSPQLIMDAVGDKSISIHTHKFGGPYNDDIVTGWYNVGVLCFTNNKIGREVSGKWKNWLLKTDHQYYAKYGRTGDQGYLNLFPKMWPDEVCVFDEGLGIDHAAPWCCDQNTKREDLNFYHFSHYCHLGNTWRDANKKEWNPSKYPGVKKLYEEYFEAINSLL